MPACGLKDHNSSTLFLNSVLTRVFKLFVQWMSSEKLLKIKNIVQLNSWMYHKAVDKFWHDWLICPKLQSHSHQQFQISKNQIHQDKKLKKVTRQCTNLIIRTFLCVSFKIYCDVWTKRKDVRKNYTPQFSIFYVFSEYLHFCAPLI